jgi:GNAT superfamily N-acetyltransferase
MNLVRARRLIVGTSSTRAGDLDVNPVTADRWDDLAELFQRPGPRGGRQATANCWCAVWRDPARTSEQAREALNDRVAEGDVPGLLAYRDGQAVGWVSVAPRGHFGGLLRSPMFRPQDDDRGVYVVTCFAVDRRARGEGVAGRLLEAAVRYAVERGATAVEAYPGDPPDYKGRIDWFLDAGFVPVREAGKRTVVRYDVGQHRRGKP